MNLKQHLKRLRISSHCHRQGNQLKALLIGINLRWAAVPLILLSSACTTLIPNKSSNCDRFCQQRQERLFTQLALVKEQRTPYIAGQLQGQCKEKIYAGCERYDTTLPAINGSHDTYHYGGYYYDSDLMAQKLGVTIFLFAFRLNFEPCMPIDDAFLSKLNRYLRDHFGIHYCGNCGCW